MASEYLNNRDRRQYSSIFILMVSTAPPQPKKTFKSNITARQLVDIWSSLPTDSNEPELCLHLVSKIFEHLGYGHDRVKIQPNISSGAALKPDYLIYNDSTQAPVLVVEIKRRIPILATASDAAFISTCERNSLYRDAVGLSAPPNNGILQYLDVTKVKSECLADYGLVFNGDFFQLWRRVGGLIMPLTTIKRVTKTNLPKLLKELAKCLQTPPAALVTAIWNRKGGVAKTTNTINVAACLAIAGKKVLLIDLDPQNDLTTGIGLKANFAPDYFDLTYEKLQLKELDFAKTIVAASIQTKTYRTSDKQEFQLSLLSADNKRLNAINDTLYAHKPHVIFNQILDLVRHEYDYIFIDSSPKHDRLTECLLCTAEALLLPLDSGCKSLSHAIELSQQVIPGIQAMRNKSDDFTLGPWNLGLLFSNCPSEITTGVGIKQSIDKVIASKGFTGKKVNTRIVNLAKVKDAEFKEMPVVCWQNSPVTKLYHELTQEVFLGHNCITE
jgi:chromosome partitioning protein